MHLSEVTTSLKVGDIVNEGQQIGTMGGTGFGEENRYTSHLHYELRIDGKLVNPVGEDGSLIDPQKLITPSNVKPISPMEALNNELDRLSKSYVYSQEYIEKRTKEINNAKIKLNEKQ